MHRFQKFLQQWQGKHLWKFHVKFRSSYCKFAFQKSYDSKWLASLLWKANWISITYCKADQSLLPKTCNQKPNIISIHALYLLLQVLIFDWQTFRVCWRTQIWVFPQVKHHNLWYHPYNVRVSLNYLKTSGTKISIQLELLKVYPLWSYHWSSRKQRFYGECLLCIFELDLWFVHQILVIRDRQGLM